MQTSRVIDTWILASAAIVGGISGMVMLGWIIEAQPLVQIYPSTVPVPFNAALCLLLCAASLALMEAGARGWAAAAAILAAAIALLTLAEYATGAGWGINTIFVRPFDVSSRSVSGRMAINSCVGFVLCGAALAVAASAPRLPARCLIAMALLGSLVAAIGAVLFLGYFTGVDTSAIWDESARMAPQTALCFILLGIAIVLLAKRRTLGLPLWLPIPVFVGIVAASLSISQAIRAEQSARITQLVWSEARQMGRAADLYLSSLYQAIGRIAELRDPQGAMPRALWEKHAEVHLRGFPALANLVWADAAGRVEWAAYGAPVYNVVGLNLNTYPDIAETLNAAIRSQFPKASSFGRGELRRAGKAFIYVKPVWAGGQYHGSLLAVINLTRLFTDLLGMADFELLSITVTEDGSVMFSNADAGPNPAQASAASVRILNLDKSWILSADPTPILISDIDSPTPNYVALAGILIASLMAWSVFLALRRQRDIQAVRLSEGRLALAVSGTSDGLWDWDIGSGEVYYSPRFLDMLGLQDHEFMPPASAFVRMIHAEDRETMISARRAHLQDRKRFDVTVRILHLDGHYIWLNLRGQAVWDASGMATRMTGFATDVSRTKEVETMKSEFVTNFSHELRTPLTSLRGAVALIGCGSLGTVPPLMQGMVDIAQKNCERLVLLINDILDLNIIESGHTHFAFATKELNLLLQEAVDANRVSATANGTKFVFEPVEPAAFVEVDPARLLQALNNLITNAAKFSPADAVVTVSASRRMGKLRVCISDDGPGIPTDFRSRVFSKFAQADGSATRQRGGTGLGLNITQQIINRLGGEIGFDTAMGKGTTFWFELPEAAAPADGGAPVPPGFADAAAWPKPILLNRVEAGGDAEVARPIAAGGRTLIPRILHIEDDADFCQLIAQLVGDKATIVAAATLAEGRDALGSGRFDLVILDLAMPDGSGLTLLERLGVTETKLPILILSASEVDATIRQQVDATLVKSRVTEKEIADRVGKLLNASSVSAQLEV